MKTNRNLVVAGDVIVDWLQACQGSRKAVHAWLQASSARLYRQPGGALQLARLIEACVKSSENEASWNLVQPQEIPVGLMPGDPAYHHCYSLWAPFPYGNKPPLDREKSAWRIEHFLGLDRKEPVSTGSAKQPSLSLPAAELLVLDDANLGFRDLSAEWLTFLDSHAGWVLVKMSQPIAQGALWDFLIRSHADRLVVVTTAEDLRKTAIQVSENISWERTAQDVVWELTYNPAVNSLSQARHLVVSFDCAGAILLERDPGGSPHARLFFDPAMMENDWERQHSGIMLGYTTCLTAALARQIVTEPTKPDVGAGIQAGVAAARWLHREGFGPRGTRPEEAKLAFPYEAVAKEICRQEQPLAEAPIQDPAGSLLTPPPPDKPRLQRGFWTILEDRYTDQLDAVARQIVLEGGKGALRQVPIGRFGALVTVDRREIEALNGIQRLISEYCAVPQKKPLSIAVFGPPGAGKSFGVEQVARSISGDVAVLTFNLSQFRHPDALLDALHQVRDAGLSGKIPLVFWDEFDSGLDGQPLGWLRYFLAPMQDGAFQQGQIVHPIGRSIFVFAGGTSHRMDLFGQNLPEEEQRAVKLPDFVSRLKGFLNVLGPNPIEGEAGDPYCVLRRALILRSIFERNAPQLLGNQDGKDVVRIDSGLLRAFLLTGRYKHGVRSMESLVSMSSLSGRTSYERSCLPPEEQLNLHVVAPEFLALMQKIELDGVLLSRLAEAAHGVFCDGLRTAGYKFGAVTDEKKKTHSALRPFAELPPDEQDQNRQNVRDIAEKLVLAGYIMRPARSNEPPFKFPGDDLETLAEREHERWMRDKLAAGWSYAARTDKARKFHQASLPWSELPESEKEKDRQMVRGIPAILARAGYAVERVG